MSSNHQRKQSIRQSNEPADGVLVERAVTGDERAFEVLVSRYQHSLLNSIQTILKDHEQANDVFQEVLLQLSLYLPTLRRDVPLQPWLFQVARRRCLDELRKGRARPALRFSELSKDDVQALTETIQDPHPLPEEILEQVDLHAALQQAIGKLPNGWEAIVDLRFFGDLRFTEIAQALDMPLSTVKPYCYRSLQRLRPLVEDRLPRVRVKEVHPLVLDT